jgi:Glycosyl hydrolases family 2, TIM barrel domain/Glycosyl hydrolases family 2
VLNHPLPQARRDLWLPLDVGAAELLDVEHARHRCTFRVPDQWNVHTLLRFGAVDWRATVTLDGHELGTHEGGYTHFTFDAGALEPGSEHELVVDAYDPLDDAFGQAKGKQRGSHDIWYTRTIGSWRPAWIEGVPDEYIRDPQPLVDAIEIENPRLWSPSDPHLYDVELRHGDDVVLSYVGFRTIERRGRDLYLNGEKLRIAGVLDQGFWPTTVYSATDEELHADVAAAKELGFNLARKHVKVEDPRWYAHCDRMGLLVAQDMPSSHSLATDVSRERFLEEWIEVIKQLRNHPSVVMWIPINEDWGEPPPAFQSNLVRVTRTEDPTRLVVDASGWKQLEDTDLVDVHDYGAELTEHVEKRRDDIPLWIGELGGLSVLQASATKPPTRGEKTPSPSATEGGTGEFVYRHVDDLVEGYRGIVEQIPDDVAGFCWTQLADVEQEQNGLLTDDRRPKADPAAIRAVNEEFLRRA